MNKIKIMALLLVFIFFNCDPSSDDHPPPLPPQPDVYVAGYYQDGSMSMENQACFWVNGKRTDIGYNSIPKGFTVVDGKIYAAITETYNYDTAHCWVDGNKIDLNRPGNLNGNYSNRSRANAITVYNDYVYVAGSHNYMKSSSSYPYKACYWRIQKNSGYGQLIDLPDAFENSEATAIVVEDGKVYVAGNASGSTAFYWIDGNITYLLGSGFSTYVTSMAVKNGNVYIVGYTAGNYGKIPCYWINGEAVNLVNVVNKLKETIMTSIVLKEDKVYITCSDCYGDNPYYLIDGEKYELTRNTYSTADAIAVEDNKVYVAGCTNGVANNCFYKACYWVDGKQTVLETGRNSYVGVTSIVVRQKEQ
jgi:hypothetical protein